MTSQEIKNNSVTKKTESERSRPVSNGMEATLYNQKGTEAGKIKLPESVFGTPWNSDLVHQVITSMQMSQRKPYAHTKTRGEVRGGGKKPWKQKGTGRARHGSTRSPIWVGGGVAHGPRNDKNFDRKVNRTMKAKALYSILSAKLRDNQIIFIDSLSFKEPKTKDAKAVLQSFAKSTGMKDLITKKNNAIYITLGKKDITVEKSFNNFPNITTDELRNMNPIDLMHHKYLIITEPETSLAFLTSKFVSKSLATKN